MWLSEFVVPVEFNVVISMQTQLSSADRQFVLTKLEVLVELGVGVLEVGKRRAIE